MGKDRRDTAGWWMLDRGDVFSFRKRYVTRIGSTRRGRAQITAALWGSVGRNCPVTACIFSALQKLLQCELCHVPLLWSDSATEIFNEIRLEQVLELKEQAGEYFLLPSQVRVFCKYLAEGGCWCYCTAMACGTSSLLPVLWKIRSSLLGLFSD